MFGIELNITGPADIDPHIAADLPTRLLQRLQKGRGSIKITRMPNTRTS